MNLAPCLPLPELQLNWCLQDQPGTSAAGEAQDEAVEVRERMGGGLLEELQLHEGIDSRAFWVSIDWLI